MVLFGSMSIGYPIYMNSQTHTNQNYLKTFDRTCNVLSLSGGGSFGAVEVGILKTIYLPKYDIITGVSAGALNAGLLSYYNSDKNWSITYGIDKLIDLYSNMRTEDVYESEYFDFYKYWSYYSTKPLRRTLNKVLTEISTKNNFTKTNPVLIGTTNLNQGWLDTFDFNSYLVDDQVEILMASTAIPIIFPPNVINGTTYVDGGTVSNQILIGLKGKIKCSSYNITYINSHQKLPVIDTIDSFRLYTDRIIKLVKSSFDDQVVLLEGSKCKYPSGKIYYYYPDDKMLSNYSILNMDYGADLIDIGAKNHYVDIFDYCI
jgi:predicted patatin/cPLA2 family phospholipase